MVIRIFNRKMCILAELGAYTHKGPNLAMATFASGAFVRLPTELLEKLLRLRLRGSEWNVLLWVVRQTYGWNRAWAPFTWYRIAKELGMDRSRTYRAGQALVARRLFTVQIGQIALQAESTAWASQGGTSPVVSRPRFVPGSYGAARQRKTLPDNNASVANEQPKRCSQATLFRRAKDSSKDKLKTYKDRTPTDDARHRLGTMANTQRPPLAGAARPIPRKYARLSQS
jgi:phage replication O-like protein O